MSTIYSYSVHMIIHFSAPGTKKTTVISFFVIEH